MQVLSHYNKSHEIYIGTQIGTLKKCTTNKSSKEKKNNKTLKEIRNLKDTCETDIGVKITSMCWGNPEQTEIILGQSNNTVRTYDTKSDTSKLKLRINDKDDLVGVFPCENVTVTCTNTGKLCLWENDKSDKELNVGEHVAAFKQCTSTKNVLATGGKGNALKIWDISVPKCTFTAKNEPHDSLQLAVPVWVSDITFMPESEALIATTSRYGKVRLYDQRAQRRPVIIVDVGVAVASISPCYHQRSVIVGTTTGTMQFIDLRAPAKALNTYKDFAGSVTAVACDKKDPFIVSVSLDRFMRVHHMNTKKLVYKVYMKTKPSCLLLKTIESEETVTATTEDCENQSDSDSDDCLSGLPTIQ